jgi:(1->4)-alpha-D-glucan 1-alpha-D-glucosylmutase
MELTLPELLERWDEGLPKLWLIWKTLQLRDESPELFRGSYAPVLASGHNAECVVAYVRAGRLLTVVPRLIQRFGPEEDTSVAVPPGRWRNAFTLERVAGGETPIRTLLKDFSVALLVREAVT